MFALNVSVSVDETTIDSADGDASDESLRDKFFKRKTLSRRAEKFLCTGTQLLVMSCGDVKLSDRRNASGRRRGRQVRILCGGCHALNRVDSRSGGLRILVSVRIDSRIAE